MDYGPLAIDPNQLSPISTQAISHRPLAIDPKQPTKTPSSPSLKSSSLADLLNNR